MADEAVTVLNLTAGTASADVIVDTEGGQSISAGDTAVITIDNPADHYIFSFYGSGAATATVQAGDNPPAMKAGLGSKALTIPSGDLILAVLDMSRHLHNDGKVRIDIATNAVVVGCHKIPKTI